MALAHRPLRRRLIKWEGDLKVFNIKRLNAMQNLAKLIRIEPAFDDPKLVRALFERHAPYRSIAEYIPRKPDEPAVRYFRGNWAVGGEPQAKDSVIEGVIASI